MRRLICERGDGHVAIEADEIIPGLWQGSQPPLGPGVSESGFQVLVLCARKFQPLATEFPGTQVIHAPTDDHPWAPVTAENLEVASAAARAVAAHLKNKTKVLVTCLAGVNRSALVVGLAIHEHLGYSGKTCIELIRGRRKNLFGEPYALTNVSFVRFLETLPSRNHP